ncbi:MAG: tRNA pseudouridine(55) synthase TruB [Patescibacteria group bacterium]
MNKPPGWTSFDVVGYLRTKLRQPTPTPPERGMRKMKVGHAGTLDPFATGLLIIGVGREATRRLDEFKNLKKTYRATIHLGATSNTDDKTGVITELMATNVDQPTPSFALATEGRPTPRAACIAFGDAWPKRGIENVLKQLVGKQEQIPPMFSAKQIGGTRLYKLARKGIEIKREPAPIEIFEIKLLNYIYPRLEIEVSCSTGTYVRTLARTIGDKLGTGGYCEELERTAIGEYNLSEARTPDEISFQI